MNKKAVKEKFEHALNVLRNNKSFYTTNDAKALKRYHKDIHQRVDEACLIYSSIFDISFNEAVKELDASWLLKEE